MTHTREPVAWMYPCDLERFTKEEAVADAFSIEVGSNTKGETVPLYSAEQIQQLEQQRDELVAEAKQLFEHRLEWRRSVFGCENSDYQYLVMTKEYPVIAQLIAKAKQEIK